MRAEMGECPDCTPESKCDAHWCCAGCDRVDPTHTQDAAGRPAKNDATLVLGETPLGDTAVFLRIPNQPDILLR
jgi:hypothetical protein